MKSKKVTYTNFDSTKHIHITTLNSPAVVLLWYYLSRVSDRVQLTGYNRILPVY